MSKKRHITQRSLHLWFTVALIVTGLAIIVFLPAFSLVAVLGLLVAFVAGNGLIHSNAHSLTRDVIIEYALVAIVAGVVLAGAILTAF